MSQYAKYQIDSESPIKRVAKVFISLHYYIFLQLYRMSRRALGQTVAGTLVIVIYHSVKTEYRDRFSKQMDALCKAGHAVPADYSAPLEDGAHYIAVTFDDGYQNIIDNALPEMSKRNIPAVIFVTTGYLGKRAEWVVDRRSHNYGETLLTEEQIRSLHKEGIVFGSHTVSHPCFAGLERHAVEREIGESKATLEQLLSDRITLCSLPYGSVDGDGSEIFEAAGYERVYLNVPRQRGSSSDDIYYGRQDVKPDEWAIEYGLKFRGAYEWVPIVGSLKRRVTKIFKQSV